MSEFQRYKRLAIYIAAAFLSVAGIMVNAAHLYYMAALLLALPVTSYVVGLAALRGLDFGLEGPGSGWEGETTTFHVVARSRSRAPRFFLQARLHLPRWLRPVDAGSQLFNAMPGVETRVPYRVDLLKRGLYVVDAVTVIARDPLGIYSFSRTVRVDTEVLVYPVPQAVPQMPISGSERYGFRDLPIVAVRGSGVDPDGVREYVPGDPLRRMHWRSTARTGRLNVIEFEESRAIGLVMVLDLRRGSDVGEGKQTTLEHLVKGAASLAQEAVRQGASVRLVTSNPADPACIAGRGTDHLYVILGALARAVADDPEPLSQNLVARVGLLPPGSALVVLTADQDRNLPGMLAHYTATGAEVLVIYTTARSVRSEAPLDQGLTPWQEGLLAAGAMPCLLNVPAEGAIRLEAVGDDRSRYSAAK